MAAALVWAAVLLWASLAAGCSARAGNLTAAVEVVCGSGGVAAGAGSLPPGAQVPRGLMRLSPDTDPLVPAMSLPWQHFGGYCYSDRHVRAFTHVHMVGAGVTGLGYLGVMPVAADASAALFRRSAARSEFEHSGEAASPGTYRVELLGPGVLAELAAAGSHAALHRYTWRGDPAARTVLVDPHAAVTEGAAARAAVAVTSRGASGWLLGKGSLARRFGGVRVFFCVEADVGAVRWGVRDGEALRPGDGSAQGGATGAYLSFAEPAVTLRVGLSFLSAAQARANLEAQARPFDSLDAASEAAAAGWEAELGAVKLSGGTDASRRKFYSLWYNTLLAPTRWDEPGGSYLGFDGAPRRLSATDGAFYTDLSLWDVHRTQLPLLTLLRPTVARDVARSLVRMLEEGGELPRWPLANGYTGCMFGSGGARFLADAAAKGLRFDVRAAYLGARAQALPPERGARVTREGFDDYASKGWVASETSEQGACYSLAYATDDYAAGTLAALAAEAADAAFFYNRSRSSYRNSWGLARGFFCPRAADGTFACPADPVLDTKNYKEGNAWHYRFDVPHDPLGLAALFEASGLSLVNELRTFLDRAREYPGTAIPNPYFWVGNEHDLFHPYLFHYLGRADLAHEHVRWTLEHRFSAAPDGVPGNDDYGATSAWAVWAMLGLYPEPAGPHPPRYLLGSPSFAAVALDVEGARVSLVAHGSCGACVFVERAALNGVPIDVQRDPFVPHAHLARDGAVLEYWMSEERPAWAAR